MSSPYTIEPSGRATVCSPGCRHPTCVAIAKRVREQRAEELVALVVDGVGQARLGAIDEFVEMAAGTR